MAIRHSFLDMRRFQYGMDGLKKAFDAVRATEDSEADNREVFTGADAIGRFGVGKNMVASMRHWATVAGVIEELQGSSPTCHYCVGSSCLF